MKTSINVNNLLNMLERSLVKYQNLAKREHEITNFEDAERFRNIGSGISLAMGIVIKEAEEPKDDY